MGNLVPTRGSVKTLVTFLLDRTGSMSKVRDITIEAFNGYLTELQDHPEGIYFTFLQFDSTSLDKICIAQPVDRVRGLDRDTYIPRANTPLIDAAYKTIKAVEASVLLNPVDKVVICIQTDGEENYSTEYTWEELHTLIEEKKKLDWQFNFMGAGIDAYKQGAKMGIGAGSTVSYDIASPAATRSTFRATAANTRSFAAGQSVNTDFSMTQKIAAGDKFIPDPQATLNLTTPISQQTSGPNQDKKLQVVADFNL